MKRRGHFRSKKGKSKPFPVVAIGASAGGLEAITELLKNLPTHTGMAFIYIQHLDPTHKSMLADILARSTKMNVQNAKHLLPIEPDNVYVLPPDKDMVIADGVLKLNKRQSKPAVSMPIDKFFVSLASDRGEGSIAVVLSGNAHDGTLGLKAIKEAGGITFAQNDTAKFESMPKSAIADGHVDMIRSPKDIASELIRISKNTAVLDQVMHEKGDGNINDDDLTPIIDLLRKSTGVDFQHYKVNTIKRRIVRRILLQKFETPADYTKYLKEHPNEIPLLYHDLLINVTSFFRDPDTLEYLKKTILPRIVKSKSPREAVRIWVPACSSGEEAYSFAIILNEILSDLALHVPIQIFASDLSDHAIAKARIGLYSKNDLVEVSPKRLQRFFTKVDGSYHINKSIRDCCVFATHNVFSDPPFSRLDVVSCCNLMIYLDPVLQKKLLATFHYSLNKDGYLVLGKSETIGESRQLFSQVEKRYKVYAPKIGGSDKARFEISHRAPENDLKTNPSGNAFRKHLVTETNFERKVEQILLTKYVPASAVVNKDLDIIQLHGQVSFFFELSPGKPSLNLLKVARSGLGLELKGIIHKASKSNHPEKKNGIEMNYNGSAFSVSIEVIPLSEKDEEQLYLVILEKLQFASSDPTRLKASKDQTVKRLRQELEMAKEEMRSFLEEQEASSEELQSANEEVVSSNEELQSINEELETSKEEVESTNEELLTINNQLQIRNSQLSESYDYVEAVFNTVREPMLVLDRDLRVKSANRGFYRTFRVKEEDTEGMMIYDLGNGQWNITQLRHLLTEINSGNTAFEGFEVAHDFPGLGKKLMLLNARLVVQNAHQKQLILLAIEDITEQRRAQDAVAHRSEELETAVSEGTRELKAANSELQRSNTELLEFAHVASHDLQEPLRKILTFIDRIQNRKDGGLAAPDREYFEKIVQSSKRMTKLIDDLLNFSSLSFSDKKFVKADLNKTLMDVLPDLEIRINEKKARIDYPNKLPIIQAIPLQMEQLFHNLLTNALKFTRADVPPVIEITCRRLSKQEVNENKNLNDSLTYEEIVFKDNGIGFKPKFAEQIFIIFQRLNDRKLYSGTGIGLALCRKIANNHKGDIYAESLKGGSAFHVILPLKQPKERYGTGK